MHISERLQYCKKCTNRKFDNVNGLVCSITSQKPIFEEECSTFSEDASVKEYSSEPELVPGAESAQMSPKDVMLMVLLVVVYTFSLSKILPLVDAWDEDAAITYFFAALFLNTVALTGIRSYKPLNYSFWISWLMYLSISLIAFFNYPNPLLMIVFSGLTLLFFPTIYFILVNPKRRKLKKIKSASQN